MNQSLLDCVEIGPDDAEFSLIWLHGLGANGHDFEPVVSELGLSADQKIRFVFPHAPQMPVTINSGVVMPAWYDIASMDFTAEQDEAGIRRSEQQLIKLIERENQRGVKTENIVLAGFSQGGAIVLHTGLRYPQRLAGIMALSTYLPLDQLLADERQEANHETSIFMAHGSHDQVVPIRLSEMSRDYLQELGYPVEWHRYFMEHSVHPDEISDISHWLSSLTSRADN